MPFVYALSDISLEPILKCKIIQAEGGLFFLCLLNSKVILKNESGDPLVATKGSQGDHKRITRGSPEDSSREIRELI
jgi:hypothetical protein